MKKLERFLCMLALLSVVFISYNLEGGLSIAVIALPLLALFYLTCLPFLITSDSRDKGWVLIAVLCGAGLAYSLMSLLAFLLGKISRLDMLENCSIVTAVAGIICAIKFRRTGNHFYSRLMLRYLPLMIAVIRCALFFKAPVH